MDLPDLDYTDRTYLTEMTGATFQMFLDPDPTFVALPFTASANFAASGDRVLVMARDTRGVSMFSGDGMLVCEMWVDRPRRPVTDQVWEAEVERRLAPRSGASHVVDHARSCVPSEHLPGRSLPHRAQAG